MSIAGEMSCGDPWESIDRGVQAWLMEYRSDMYLRAGLRIKDGQEDRAEERAAWMQELLVKYIYLMDRLECQYHRRELRASRPWAEGVGRYDHEPLGLW